MSILVVSLYITYCRTLLSNIFSYTIVSDLVGYRYLIENVVAELWPNLLFLYSRSGETRELYIVRGYFKEE